MRDDKDSCDFIMSADYEKYQKYVRDYDLTKIQREELIQTVWGVMESFVDTAFGLHPVQQCREYLSDGDLQSPAGRVKLFSLSNCFKSVAVTCGN